MYAVESSGWFGHRWEIRLHCKLLFDRDGVTGRSFYEFALQSGKNGENRISLRDGRMAGVSDLSISILGKCGNLLLRPDVTLDWLLVLATDVQLLVYLHDLGLLITPSARQHRLMVPRPVALSRVGRLARKFLKTPRKPAPDATS